MFTDFTQNDEDVARLIELVAVEESLLVLGDVLRADVSLDLPFRAICAVYRRLFALGVDDVRTRLCYARYVLLHSVADDEADRIIAEVEAPARAAGLWDGHHLGHHPVFFA